MYGILAGFGISTDRYAVTPAHTLAETLLAGNTTGAKDIIVDSGQVISTDNATTANRYEILFNNSLGNDYIHIRRNGAGDGGRLQISGGGAILDQNISGRQLEFNVGLSNRFTFTDTGGTTRPVLAFHDDTNGNDGLFTISALASADRTWTAPDATGVIVVDTTARHSIVVAVSDEDTDLTTGTNKMRFRMPRGMELDSVKASVNTAPAGADIEVDITESAVSILSTVISIDAGDTTSEDSATPPVISDSTLADDAIIGIDIDQVGSSTAGNGLKVTLNGYFTN